MGSFTFNPVLSEIQSHMAAMSPAAQAAVKMANPSLPSPDATVNSPSVLPPGTLLPHPTDEPPPGNIAMPNSAPPLMPSAQPGVTAPRGTVAGETNEMGRLLHTGSGISQIGSKIENSRLGEAHPFLGKLLGGLAQGAATVGDIGLSAVAPEIAINTPGTAYHHQALVNQEGRQVNAATENAQKQAQAASENATAGKTNAETAEVVPEAEARIGQANATAGHENAETANLQNPPANLAQAYAHAVMDAIKRGVDPSTDPIVGHISDAIVSLQPKQNTPQVGEHVNLTLNGKPTIGTYHPDTGKTTDSSGKEIPNPTPYERPNVTNVNSGAKEDAALKKQIFTAYTPVMDSAERFNVMSKNYEDAMKTHDQQAMLSLLYNHMGMTMGLQKGARMTQALIAEAQKSQPWLQGLKAKFDDQGYLTGVTLSPQQMQEMVHNAQGRFSEDVGKARNESQYLGAKDDGPARTPNSSTINYYMNQADGDANKAKQLAAQDGWMIGRGAK